MVLGVPVLKHFRVNTLFEFFWTEHFGVIGFCNDRLE